ncbi:hypothetical protein E4T56_gene2078 [Termitomyces sp. T112]|nr:hypothetical protein E4T56_gene2078 [Termitomyces sp. T112]
MPEPYDFGTPDNQEWFVDDLHSTPTPANSDTFLANSDGPLANSDIFPAAASASPGLPALPLDFLHFPWTSCTSPGLPALLLDFLSPWDHSPAMPDPITCHQLNTLAPLIYPGVL